MRLPLAVISLVALVAFAGCATPTPQDRISQNKSLFESFPSDVQRKVSAGQVDIGFTPEMVELALGKPGRKLSRADGSGESEVWVFYHRQPRLGFGFGVGGGSYGSGVSTGVSVNTASDDDEETMRVVFQDGKVTSVERSAK